ncbi:MAG TPA: ABC transporter substrate-binding protein [Ilumatobacteraceae bacterium]|nr:ABC transporter substrate-binding protein [Ilumatobacteraceae bacterium]
MHQPWGGGALLCPLRRVRRIVRAFAVPAIVAALAACSGGSESAAPYVPSLSDDFITVGSFDFAENVILAEVYSQGLEAAGYKVHRAFRLGPREFVGPALSAGLVEFVPEYAGTGAEFYSLGHADPTDDVARTHDEFARAVEGDRLEALAAAPAQDANTFVVTRATADRLHLRTLSDLAPVAGSLTFGGPPECPTRRLCLAGLADTYGLTFGTVITLDTGGPLTLEALKEGVVDVALLFTTDPAIANLGLVELTDDRGLQPAESVTPLVRKEVVDQWGSAVVGVIDGVSARLTTDVVRDLNGAVALGDSDVAAVAAAWWSGTGS